MDYSHYLLEDFINDQHFRKWVTNPAPEDHSFWQEWLEKHPEKHQVVEHAREMVLFLSFDIIQPSEEDQQEIKANIKNRIRKETTHLQIRNTSNHYPFAMAANRTLRLWRPYFTIAALLTSFIVVTGIIISLKFFPAQTEYTTGYGETKNIVLPDGSSVIMNANSTLRYSDNWQKTHQREIWLTGEAFFHVLKKPDWQHAKFIVHTNNLSVEVLGTTFNVNNRRGMVKVVLASGKVKLNPTNTADKGLMMNPKDLVEFHEGEKGFVKRLVEPETYTSWRHHTLIFNETPVSEIAQLLEDTYGMKVIFKNKKLKHRRFTGSIPNQNIGLFLEIMAESMNINITKEKQTVFISNK